MHVNPNDHVAARTLLAGITSKQLRDQPPLDRSGSTSKIATTGAAAPVPRTTPAPLGLKDIDLAPPPSTQGELTLEGIRDAWGTNDPNYDLTGDGVVNVHDLLQLLAKLSANAEQPATVESADIAPDTEDVAGAPPAAATDTPSLGEVDPDQLTLEGIRDAWGNDDARYDLTGDGVVNVHDLLRLLARMNKSNQQGGEDGAGAPPVESVDAEALVAAEGPAQKSDDGSITMQGLLDAWGTDNEMYDLNRDGTVNVHDLLRYLQKISTAPDGSDDAVESPASLARAEAEAAVAQSGPTGGNGSTEPITIESMRDAWGTDDPRHDLNGDGTVNVHDLLLLFAKLAQRQDGQSPPIRSASLADAAVSNISPAGARTDALADLLMKRLEQAGFEHQPPRNLHDYLDQVRVSDSERQALLGKLSARYPHGLGINMTG